jgi:undecaprenyl-diphosphatase
VSHTVLAGFCNLGNRRTALLTALSAALLLSIAAAIALGASQAVDQGTLQSLRRHAYPWLTDVMVAVTFLGSWPVILAGVAVFAWLNRRYPHRGTCFLVVAIAGAAFLSLSLKLVFHRPRPTIVPPLVTVGSYSFPSGHALLSLTFYGTIAYLVACRTASWWRAWLIRLGAVFFVVLIGLSRVYLGVHYVTDVVAGYATAVAWVTALALSRALFRWPGDTPGASGR